MNNPKVLLVTPSLIQKGGVVEFNKMLLKYCKYTLQPFEIKSGLKKSGLQKSLLVIVDYLNFVCILLSSKIRIVHVNPSLGINSIIRDGLFIYLSKIFKKKVYVHWHGWNPEKEHLLHGKTGFFIRKTFCKADHIKFLSVHFEQKFREIGFRNTTSVGCTFIDDELLQSSVRKRDNRKLRILFLSTISINKGIYIALEAHKIIISKIPNAELLVAGIGQELKKAKVYVEQNKISNVTFYGYVSGKEKQDIFINSDIYIFPSYYEGMPTSVLEAIGFGLPVVCSNAGALPEIFKNGKMGYILNSNTAEEFADKLVLLLDPESRMTISEFNTTYAKENFLASKVIRRIEMDYLNLI